MVREKTLAVKEWLKFAELCDNRRCQKREGGVRVPL